MAVTWRMPRFDHSLPRDRSFVLELVAKTATAHGGTKSAPCEFGLDTPAIFMRLRSCYTYGRLTSLISGGHAPADFLAWVYSQGVRNSKPIPTSCWLG